MPIKRRSLILGFGGVLATRMRLNGQAFERSESLKPGEYFAALNENPEGGCGGERGCGVVLLSLARGEVPGCCWPPPANAVRPAAAVPARSWPNRAKSFSCTWKPSTVRARLLPLAGM